MGKLWDDKVSRRKLLGGAAATSAALPVLHELIPHEGLHGGGSQAQAAVEHAHGPGNVEPGHAAVYEFDATPFGLHLYHCHSTPLAEHIAKGLYGAFLIDPKTS